jgi:hypothetical protein
VANEVIGEAAFLDEEYLELRIKEKHVKSLTFSRSNNHPLQISENFEDTGYVFREKAWCQEAVKCRLGAL